MKSSSGKKYTAVFFTLYICLLISLIYFAVNANQSKGTQKLYREQTEVSSAFINEMKIYEEKKQQKEKDTSASWKPSKAFVLTAMTIASIIDIVIVLIWANHENKKKLAAGTESAIRKRTHSKWFWNLISMGIVQLKKEKLMINWWNMLIVGIILLFAKILFSHFLVE